MTHSAIGLSPDLLTDIFPFHLVIDRAGKLIQIGKVLQRLCPNLNQERQFEQHFAIQRPTTAFDFDEIRTHLQSLFILEVHPASTLLKGQMVYIDEQDLLLFLGSPWIPDLNTLKSSGLTLKDFAIHDSIIDYLLLLQAQKMALTDARKLADKLKRQRAEVRKALQQEKELSDLKSRFITTASHEFRTPLGIIASSAGILQDYAAKIDDGMRKKHLARIQAAVNRIASLLDDVLTMNQVEAGMLRAQPQPIKLAAFCQEIVEEMQANTSHQLLYTVSPNLLEQLVPLDPNLLHQLLINLISNAVKYTPEPSNITLNLTYQESQIVLTVQDSGIGIPPEDLASIFQPFHRASNVGTIAGTGLGLAIAKHCTDLHHGDIAISSEIGVGTTLTVTIPFQSAADSTPLNQEPIMC